MVLDDTKIVKISTELKEAIEKLEDLIAGSKGDIKDSDTNVQSKWIAHELNQMISLKRGNFDVFEEIFIFIYKSICDGAVSLKGSKRHVTTFLHYMYYECLIGRRW